MKKTPTGLWIPDATEVKEHAPELVEPLPPLTVLPRLPTRRERRGAARRHRRHASALARVTSIVGHSYAFVDDDKLHEYVRRDARMLYHKKLITKQQLDLLVGSQLEPSR